MNITAEEKLMYSVMKAIYDCGIPMNFKGSMVLKACLLEAGYEETTLFIGCMVKVVRQVLSCLMQLLAMSFLP